MVSPGRHGLPNGFVEDFKRERVVRALCEVVHERGLPAVTVASIIDRAGMTRKTFYELFDNREGAVRHGVEMGNGRLRAAIDHGAMTGGWEPRVAAVVEALLQTTDADPYLAELCLVHGPGTGGRDAPLESALVQSLAGVLRPIRRKIRGPRPGPRTEELVAYGILGVIAGRLRRGETEGLEALAPELTELATLPFSSADGDG